MSHARRAWDITLLLLVAAAVQTAVEISFTNFVVVFALLGILLAELRYRARSALW